MIQFALATRPEPERVATLSGTQRWTVTETCTDDWEGGMGAWAGCRAARISRAMISGMCLRIGGIQWVSSPPMVLSRLQRFHLGFCTKGVTTL